MRRFVAVVSWALLCVSASLVVFDAAASYPVAQDKYVNDYAGVIHSVDREILQKKLRELDASRGIEGTVVTVNSIADYPTGDANIEGFALHLFNTWGVGRKGANSGFMVIVAVKDRAARIELGEGYDKHYDQQVQRIMDEVMLPRLQAGEYSRAIFDGTSRVATLTGEGVSWLDRYGWVLLAGVSTSILVAVAISLIRKGRAGWGYALLVAVFTLLMGMLFLSRLSGRFGGGRSGGGGASGRW